MSQSFRIVACLALLFALSHFVNAGVQFAAAQSTDTHLYFITNDGCAPCRQVEPSIESLKQQGFPVSTVKFDDHRQWAMQLGVDRTPTVVMVTNKRMVARHAGLIDETTLKSWFAHQGVTSATLAGRDSAAQQRRSSVAMAAPATGSSLLQPPTAGQTESRSEFVSPTMHKGTAQPGNSQERLALQATVRLRVEDPLGTSYATGTVIHGHNGEYLVATCGHVFRDAKGKGVITGQYGFADQQVKSANGTLIFYDADARDIGLVAIKTVDVIAPVAIADRATSVSRGLDVFSVGCDHGDSPTIRRSQIKNRATYDGAIKYDIYGRPVNGRSGGGLFNGRGELIGICNAAAVEVDEGIYTALDTIYWQLATVKLEHLFDRSTMVASNTRPLGNQGVPVQGGFSAPAQRSQPGSNGFAERIAAPQSTQLASIPGPNNSIRAVSWDRNAPGASDKEVIILVRSKSNPSQTEAITIQDPSPKLLNYLGTMNSSRPASHEVTRLRTLVN